MKITFHCSFFGILSPFFFFAVECGLMLCPQMLCQYYDHVSQLGGFLKNDKCEFAKIYDCEKNVVVVTSFAKQW